MFAWLESQIRGERPHLWLSRQTTRLPATGGSNYRLGHKILGKWHIVVFKGRLDGKTIFPVCLSVNHLENPPPPPVWEHSDRLLRSESCAASSPSSSWSAFEGVLGAHQSCLTVNPCFDQFEAPDRRWRQLTIGSSNKPEAQFVIWWIRAASSVAEPGLSLSMMLWTFLLVMCWLETPVWVKFRKKTKNL